MRAPELPSNPHKAVTKAPAYSRPPAGAGGAGARSEVPALPCRWPTFLIAVTAKVTSRASPAPQGYAGQPSPASRDSLPNWLDAIEDVRNSTRGPPGSGEHGARTRPRQSGGARPSPVQPEGPGRVQRDAARLRLQRRQSLAERLASPGGRGSRGQRHVLRQPGRGQADRAPSSLRAPAPPRPAPPRAPPRPASALPQSNKGRACARSRGPEGEGQRNSHPASPAAGAKDRWKVRPMDQYGWSLRVQQCERGRRGGLTYQQSEGWMGRLADGWRRDGGMEGQMEAQLDVTDRWKEDQWPNR